MNEKSSIDPNSSSILIVNENDVLLGRGKLYEKHKGNLNFQALIMATVNRYFSVLSPEEKYAISTEVVDEIHKSLGGRFLKRGNRCWVPINAIDARKKVAQALQYQRRKCIKHEAGLCSSGQDLNNNDFAPTPPPPAFIRYEQYIPYNNFFGGESERQQELFALHCSETLMQSKAQTKMDTVTSSLYNTSLVQAAANAIIANCGKPSYPSNSSWQNHSITKSRTNKLKNNIATRTSSNGTMKQRQHTEELQQATMMGCTTTSLLSDTSGIYSLPDMDLNFNNEYFEQDELVSNFIHL